MKRLSGISLGAFASLALTVMVSAARAHGDEDHSKDAAKSGAVQPTPAGAGGATSPQRLPDGSVQVPKAVQRLYTLRTVVVEEQALPASVELKGTVINDPATAGRVQATQPGIVQAGPGGLPHLGQKVAQGQVLAYLAPQANGLERAGTQAQLAEVEGQIVVAEQKMQRYAQLEGSVPQKEIDAARAEVASLGRRKQALSAGLGGRVALTAPVPGVISSNAVVAGQVVDARELLFEIVRPDRLLVEALAYDARTAGDIEQATALTAAKQPLRLSFLGAGAQLREQAIPLQFRIGAPLPALVVGQPVTVIVATRSRLKGYAVPQTAVTQNAANEPVVWLHESAERFKPRKVQVQVLDATRSVVTSGLAAGERVVVQGATLLAQVR
jgi:cobalt-zinc-cadmium efflux system membrane fusion protein